MNRAVALHLWIVERIGLQPSTSVVLTPRSLIQKLNPWLTANASRANNVNPIVDLLHSLKSSQPRLQNLLEVKGRQPAAQGEDAGGELELNVLETKGARRMH